MRVLAVSRGKNVVMANTLPPFLPWVKTLEFKKLFCNHRSRKLHNKNEKLEI